MRCGISYPEIDRYNDPENSAGLAMPKLNRDGVNIHYEVHGSGPPLLLTHGYSSTSAMWRDGRTYVTAVINPTNSSHAKRALSRGCERGMLR